jgi:hypothetical protein
MLNSLDTINVTRKGYDQMGHDALARMEASALFERQMRQGRRRRLAATLRRRANQLCSLAAAGFSGAQAHYVGLRVVALDAIHGTESRGDEFDAAFFPVKGHIESRWINVAMAYLRGEKLPPVELIQVGDAYYVRDGHHRISVALALGQCDIDAEVTQWA